MLGWFRNLWARLSVPKREVDHLLLAEQKAGNALASGELQWAYEVLSCAIESTPDDAPRLAATTAKTEILRRTLFASGLADAERAAVAHDWSEARRELGRAQALCTNDAERTLVTRRVAHAESRVARSVSEDPTASRLSELAVATGVVENQDDFLRTLAAAESAAPDQGGWRVFDLSDPRACLVWRADPIHTCFQALAVLPSDDLAAAQWVDEQVVDTVLRSEDRFLLTAAASCRPLIDRLYARGCGIRAIELLGQCTVALERLVEAYDPPRDLTHLGLDLRFLVCESDSWRAASLLNACLRSDDRSAGWVDDLGYIVDWWFRKISAVADMGFGNNVDWLIERDGKLLGLFGFVTGPFPPHLEIVLAPEIRGKGIAKTAYRLILEHLIDSDRKRFLGITHQSAVLGLGRLMQREPVRLVIGRNSPAPRAHFARFFPELGPADREPTHVKRGKPKPHVHAP